MGYKILFGEKYYGKAISECPSGFLIWCIESFDKADWTLVNECKKELSARLKLDWSPEANKVNETERKLVIALKEKEFLLDAIAMSVQVKGNPLLIESYLNNPSYMYSHIKMIADAQSPIAE